MKLLIFLIAINCYFLKIRAQDSLCMNNYYTINNKVFEPKILSTELRENQIPLPKNAVYSYWGEGDIILHNKQIIKNKHIRYDGLSDNLLIRTEFSNKETAIEKDQLIGFDIKLQKSDKTIHFTKLMYKPKYTINYESGYFQILVSGKAHLYTARRIERFDGEKSVELRNKYSYLIVKEDNSIIQFEYYSMRYICNIFGEQKQSLKQQLRKQHISLNSEDNLIKAIEIYNTL